MNKTFLFVLLFSSSCQKAPSTETRKTVPSPEVEEASFSSCKKIEANPEGNFFVTLNEQERLLIVEGKVFLWLPARPKEFVELEQGEVLLKKFCWLEVKSHRVSKVNFFKQTNSGGKWWDRWRNSPPPPPNYPPPCWPKC